MSQQIITFYSDNRDPFGMPSKFYRYLIVESEAPKLGNDIRIVTIRAISLAGPLPKDPEFISVKPSAEEALGEALEKLKNHSQLKHLNYIES